MSSESSAQVDKPASNVDKALKRLDRVVEGIQDEVERIEVRLSPIFINDPPSENKVCAEADNNESSVARTINIFASKLEDTRIRLNSWGERIDV